MENLPSELSNEEMEEILEAFDLFDTDGSGESAWGWLSRCRHTQSVPRYIRHAFFDSRKLMLSMCGAE
jgi:hypothetical protein